MSGTPASTPAGWAASRRPGVVAIALVAAAAALAPAGALELQRGTLELHRLITCHFVHWTYEQLAWDGLAFAFLAVACARRNGAAFHATLLASAVTVPLAVLAFAPEVVAYRGLSGLASAMFALLLMLERHRLTWPVAVCAVLFAAKITFEAITGGTVFVSGMGEDVVSVPVAHVTGAVAGVIGGLASSRGGARRFQLLRHRHELIEDRPPLRHQP